MFQAVCKCKRVGLAHGTLKCFVLMFLKMKNCCAHQQPVDEFTFLFNYYMYFKYYQMFYACTMI